MKKADIKIGSVYRATVSDKLTNVRIDAENPGGGWDATNLTTKKKVRIKSAQRLRAPATSAAEAKAVAAADQENARVRDERKASADGKTASERAMSRAPKAKATRRTKGTRSTKQPKTAKPAASGKAPKTRGKAQTKKRTGILDAAVQILAKAKEPMGCKDIVKQAIAKKLWSTSGKTPQATLYAAIIREISKKGKESRFEKVDRGRFQLRAGKK